MPFVRPWPAQWITHHPSGAADGERTLELRDDDLHRRLKARARADGSSMNTLVTAAVEQALATQADSRQAMRRRLQSLGLLADVLAPPLDAIHLAVALEDGTRATAPDALLFTTLDQRQAEAARSLGLQVHDVAGTTDEPTLA